MLRRVAALGVRAAVAWAAFAGVWPAAARPLPASQLPGAQPGGFTRLHNQWLINPAGTQVELGVFPMNAAVESTGRYAAVLQAGVKQHELVVIDLTTRQTTDRFALPDAFYGLAFSADGKLLVCSGGGADVLHAFAFRDGKLTEHRELRVADPNGASVVAGLTFVGRTHVVVAALLFDSGVVKADLDTGKVVWSTVLDPTAPKPQVRRRHTELPPNDDLTGSVLDEQDQPLAVACDPRKQRVYVSLWGKSAVAVLDAKDGRIIGRWATGLHPNELVLSPDGRRLFVSNGGRNSVSVLDCETGSALELLNSALAADDPPGSTPDSLALSSDGRTLFAANAYNNNVAVFDVGVAGAAHPLGFVPTAWFPVAARLSPRNDRLVVLSARGLTPSRSLKGSDPAYTPIFGLYHGTLAIVDWPKPDALEASLRQWTAIAQRCRPSTPAALVQGGPIPERVGDPSPLKHVIYIIKENRTYDQVLGDMPEGNGDPSLCLFPERVTPNIHRLARDFVLLDNFYANAEVSASGHEWSMAAYAAEIVEKTWPVWYGHEGAKAPYAAEGHYAAAIPASGALWDRAAAAGVSYRSYGEFVTNAPRDPRKLMTALPALKGHFDPEYRPWDLSYHDVARAERFISELHRFEAEGEMPRLQILRLPQDHTSGARKGQWRPAAMLADNDLALGRIVDAVSHSKFWGDTAVFVVEDDAQSGPVHVDAHRCEALVVSAWTRRNAVDSTPYTTCSMLRTMELILGLPPMSQFEASAAPMRACFQDKADLAPWNAVAAQVDIEERNPGGTRAAKISSHFDFSHEDAVDDRALNQVVWEAVRGPDAIMPAPVHAAFVYSGRAAGDDDDDRD